MLLSMPNCEEPTELVAVGAPGRKEVEYMYIYGEYVRVCMYTALIANSRVSRGRVMYDNQYRGGIL